MVSINRLNGKLANSTTPPDLIEQHLYTVLHSEKPNDPNWENPVHDWAVANGYPYPPTDTDDGSDSGDIPDSNSTQVRFITPDNGQEIHSVPFNVQVQVLGRKSPESVEVYLEGEDLGKRTAAPYTYKVNQTSNGWKTLRAVVKMPTGDQLENSIRVYVNSQQAAADNDQDLLNIDDLIKKSGNR
jgi:hypothetical protein